MYRGGGGTQYVQGGGGIMYRGGGGERGDPICTGGEGTHYVHSSVLNIHIKIDQN